MKKLFNLTKTLLVVAALLIGGVVSVCAERVYFNDFSSTGGLTIKGSGAFTTDADARFGQVFANAASAAPRTNYLLLPETVFSSFNTENEKTAMSIGFWVKHTGAANVYTYAPFFSAYSAAPNPNNTSPMMCIQSRGLLQINCNGWCDFGFDLNKDGKNNVYNTNAWEAGDANYISAGNWIADADWHYYTVTITATQATVYLDGVLKNQWNLDGTSEGQNITGFFTGANALTYVALGGNQAWNWGDNDAAFTFDDFAVYDNVLSAADIKEIICNKKGLTKELYDFYAARGTSHVSCSTNGYINVNGTSSNIIANARIEMNDRFAAQFGSGSWMIHKDYALYSVNSGARRLGILNLKAGDCVAISFPDGYAPSFSGTPNAYIAADGDVVNGDALASGTYYTIKADGMLALSAPNYGRINSITIWTSAPVLENKPVITFNSMVEHEGLYYPKVTFTSADDGVTFYDASGNDITSGYTFTSTGTLSVYAGKTGRTNSVKSTYTVDNGWILANSVNCKTLEGTIDYGSGAVCPSSGRFDEGTAFWKQLVPGLEFDGNQWYITTSNGIYAGSGNRIVSCRVLNSNRVATFKRYDYDVSGEKYDYLTSSSNSVTIKRQSSPSKNDFLREYNLYVNPSEIINVTIGSTGYSTFSSPVPLNFSGIDGLTAYVAKSVAGDKVTLSSVTTAPANTGLVLKGTADVTYNIPVTASAEAPESNLLVGCIVNTTVAADATSKFNNYVLVNNNGTPEFQSLVDNGATITGGKAFLRNGAYSVGARSLSIAFDDEATGISQIENGKLKTENYYDLQGRRVAQPQKGLYIVNGKKVVIK